MNDTGPDVRVLLDRGYPLHPVSFEWDDVLERLEQAGSKQPDGYRLSRRARRGHGIPAVRVAAFGSLLLVVLALALTVTTPWRGGPTILQRAAAALNGPRPNQVLYENVVIEASTTAGGRANVTRLQVWLAGSAPQRFRVLTRYPTLAGQPPRPASDVGGSIGSYDGLSYDAQTGTFVPVPFQYAIGRADIDPASWLRRVLTSGKAALEGTTTIAGRTVRRFLLRLHVDGRLVVSVTYDVDARTYQPVRIRVVSVAPNALQYGVPSSGLTCLPYCYDPPPPHPGGKTRYVFVYDFTAFRYLPPTPGNLMLTNIRAQHPHAKTV